MAKLISVGQIIDVAVEHYRAHFKDLIGVTLWVLVAALPLLLADLISPLDETEIASAGQLFAIVGLQLLGAVTVGVTSMWVSICLMLSIRDQMDGKTVNLKAIGKRAWSIFVPFAAVSFVVAAALSAIALLIVPGISMMFGAAMSEQFGGLLGGLGLLLFFAGAIAAVYFIAKYSIEFAFAQYALVFEKAGGKLSWTMIKESIASSRKLVKGRWWATLVRLVIPNIVFSLLIFGINLGLAFGTTVLFAIGVGLLSPIFMQIGAALGTLLVMAVSVLAMPLFSISTYALYDSLRGNRS